ncbi:unnamed protein product [Diatraea saccharalis]|uniref:Uncharacterized protein n=1 Tax=Diatraea saccharalis TaxID=40085 RepID=A0A9N9N1Q6_9NEOP|nr:unnamed protein product [Diatraea saccharalis]
MTSESDAIKTNEFLRRRKLRLLQVREQSKDIAKKVRQRAKAEKLQHIEELKSNKEREYLKHQEKLVKCLEQLYAQGVKNIGSSHHQASANKENVKKSSDKEDLSKVRGKEAAAALRKRKQEKLNQQKKLLDRKLLAREAANEISREKSLSVANKLISKSETNIPQDIPIPKPAVGVGDSKGSDENETCQKLNKNDMGTQWDSEEVPNEWEPNIPLLSLPKDDRESLKESNNIPESKSERSKRIDLFALSSEMPSSLRGGLINVSEERTNVRPSLTMVTEYLQNRALRLRETCPKKMPVVGDDLESLKQTILRTRSSKLEGSTTKNVCHVLNEQVIPVPSWHAESICELCSHHISHHNNYNRCKQFTVSNSEINEIFSSIQPKNMDVQPNPILRGSSPFRRNKDYQRIYKKPAKRDIDKSVISDADSVLNKKSSVTIYNHSTRNSRDIPLGDSDLVVRDHLIEDNAYEKALKESSNDNAKEKEHMKRLQEMRSKVAMTKQTVEREYNDTMSFLKSLPKEKSTKNSRTSHMDERRQQMQKDKHQLKLQCEYNKIERQSRKNCEMSPKSKVTSINSRKSKSPIERNLSDDFEARDLQYSWMPVPESDGNLAIHTIPTSLKEGKSGNTVKFSKVDSYHEYRSRHKHTPPTKDTNDKQPKKKSVETIVIQNDDTDSMNYSTSSSDTSSVENLNLQRNKDTKSNGAISEDENIVVYKILHSKVGKKAKERRRHKLIDEVAKVLTAMDKDKSTKINKDDNNNRNKTGTGTLDSKTNVPLEQINEGVYKIVNEKGDNISSLYFSDKPYNATEDDQNQTRPHICKKRIHKKQKFVEDGSSRNNKSRTVPSGQHPSAATSTSSFKTASINERNTMLDGDFVKLLDDNGQEAGKFYIGASGYLKDNAYEITIQLKKKDSFRKDERSEVARNNENLIAKEKEATLQELKNPDNFMPPHSELLCVNDGLNNADGSKAVYTHPGTECMDSGVQEASQHSPALDGINEKDNEVPVLDACVDKPVFTDSSKENIDKTAKCFIDKGTYTTSQLSFAIPSDFPKTDGPPRPATSTYTQTTMNSPNTRPVYIHMSSSTSTAYMSPPEIILPKFLKHKYDGYSHREAVTSQDERCITKKHRECDKDFMCSCKRCVLREKGNKLDTNTKSSKKAYVGLKKISTPPNTARNSTKSLDINRYDKSSPKVNTKCRKCKSRTTSSVDKKCRRRKIQRPCKLTTTNYVPHSDSNAPTSLKTDVNGKIDRNNLNPLIKKYVNKLLELNSNGLKAIEIANQECSSVSTPGSSIIEVSRNITGDTTEISNKISLEQIKNMIKQKILQEYVKENNIEDSIQVCNNRKPRNCLLKPLGTKRSVHKVKSLNISKKVFKSKKPKKVFNPPFPTPINEPSCSTSSPSPTSNMYIKKSSSSISKLTKETSKRIRSKSSPTPRFTNKSESTNNNTDNSDVNKAYKRLPNINNITENDMAHKYDKRSVPKADYMLPLNKATVTIPDLEDHTNGSQTHTDAPTNTSTQTSHDLDSEINLIKMAENKIQNMEKIADLTEKCTKRLSNLAKILEEVRKNKSSAYSHISTSDTASDSDQKSDKVKNISVTSRIKDPIIEVQKIQSKDSAHTLKTLPENDNKTTSEYISFLKDIPKPEECKFTTTSVEIDKYKIDVNSTVNQLINKSRTKPPPALSRITLKHGQDIIPHELSTVVEVDSPMSLKLKNQNSKGSPGDSVPEITNQINTSIVEKDVDQIVNTDIRVNPDLLQNNSDIVSKQHSSDNGSSGDTKVEMMDLKQFNEVMLKPFITLQEYAKQCDVGILDEGSNIDDNIKDDLVNDEMIECSLHSDGSLPDVIAELLKRNIIAEPFKFDTISNINSTTVSSESTLSLLALSKARQNRKKSRVAFQSKENTSETSDTLSISSNPDLENAFKKLGMGWASSTLKKTKERLALSSSSNTSSSSLLQFKIKNIDNQEIPSLVTDSVLSASKTSKRQNQKKFADTSKNVEQQTSFRNSMTVKEFLTNELAKRITFTNKSQRNETDEEFVSLLETKMPEQMKHSSQNILEEHSVDSLPSGSNNRARTSTPVQIFKSMTYQSSSSSNVSNGLFSNADELSSVKVTSNSIRNHSTSDKGELTVPNCSLKVRKGASDCSKSD